MHVPPGRGRGSAKACPIAVFFCMMNLNKEGVTLNLKSPRGRQTFEGMAKEHNAEAHGRLLKLSAADLAALRKDGVV